MEDNAKRLQKTQNTEELHALHSDNALFLAAVKDIIPLNKENKDGLETAPHKNYSPEQTLSKAMPDPLEAEKTEILEALNAMISGKSPFPVKQTPEFVEGPGQDTNKWLVTRLHRGEFPIQGYCDLHGLDTAGALDACESFLSQAISEGKRCVAFIHGRGLSSPRGPVLKDAVIRWITYGRYRRLILAYSSAPAWDGGAGVTYVLLRRSPQKKTRQKNKRRMF
ncbi:MAG: Smr/MutS family protein [Dissulfurimicrobium sp.]|uniref:Smr/MutS family protein n=1 Tax=Dissulfurimicrobium sp. TaxID=2022436 RepID=UPI00404AC808